MQKNTVLMAIVVCFISTISQGQAPNLGSDMLQNMLFGVSTLKGVEEVYPQVQIEVLEPAATQLSSPSKIGTLVRDDIKEQVIQALQKANIQIAQKFDSASDNAPLSLNITIFIKVAIADPPIYDTFVYTEAMQSVKLGRDNSIRSLSRTWPMQPMGLVTRNMFVLNSSKLKDTVEAEVSKQVGAFISDFQAANPNSVPRNAAGVDIEALRKTLLEDDPRSRYGAIRDNDPSLQVVNKLESAGSEEAVNVLLEFLTNNRMDRKLKQHALTALGKIGTEPAIEAIKKFETWSQKRYSNPLPFYMGLQEYAIDHFVSTDVQPIAQAKDKNNKTWAIVPLYTFYKTELGLTSLIKDDQWSIPILLNFPDMPEPRRLSETTYDTKYQLQVDGESIKVISNGKTYETTISEQTKDTDKDGLPDTLETRMQTDPKNPDSDGDGVADGKDSNPLTPKHKETNDTTEIRQAVFSALFATTNSRNMINIVDRDEFAKQEYYGFSGPIIKVSESKIGNVNLTSIDIRYQSDDTATVIISDYEASEAASAREVKLKKINGKWVVIGFGMKMVS